MIQTLDQRLETIPASGARQSNSVTIDVYTSGYSQMDCGLPGCPNGCIHDRGFMMDQREKERGFSPFFETSTGFGISISKPLKEIGDYHETFKTDRYDNLYGGHSSITMGGSKKRIDHND